MSELPSDNNAYRFPVSVKGVVLRDGAVVLVKNSRDEWELPGGKLELDETPAACVAREIEEELQLVVVPESLLDSWVYTVAAGTHVLMLTYGCTESDARKAVLSDEHEELGWVPIAKLDAVRMPENYRTSIRRWASQVGETK